MWQTVIWFQQKQKENCHWQRLAYQRDFYIKSEVLTYESFHVKNASKLAIKQQQRRFVNIEFNQIQKPNSDYRISKQSLI